MKTVRTFKELAEALKSSESYIYVEGDLKNKIVRIKATERVASGGIGSSITAATVATTILGIPATTVAISVAVAAGGFAAITSLRNNYTIEKKETNGILLRKK